MDSPLSQMTAFTEAAIRDRAAYQLTRPRFVPTPVHAPSPSASDLHRNTPPGKAVGGGAFSRPLPEMHGPPKEAPWYGHGPPRTEPPMKAHSGVIATAPPPLVSDQSRHPPVAHSSGMHSPIGLHPSHHHPHAHLHPGHPAYHQGHQSRFMIDNLLHHEQEEDELSGVSGLVSYLTGSKTLSEDSHHEQGAT